VILGLIALVCSAEAPAKAGERTPRDIQQALSSKGFNPGKIDGLWGKKSANALREFQKANGLAATGKIDDATTTVLFPEYPRLEDKSGKPSVGAGRSQTDPDMEPTSPAKAASDQKADRIPAKVDAPQKKSVADIPTVTETPPKAVTILPGVEVGADEISESEKTPRQPIAVYLLASIILATLILFICKRKAKSPTAPSPRPVEPVMVSSPDASLVFTQTLEHRNDEPAAMDVVLAPPPIPALSLAAHNDAVTDWVRQNVSRNRSRACTPDNDALTAIEERRPAAGVKQGASLVEHNAAVKQRIADNAEGSRRRYDESQRQNFGIHTTPLAAAALSTEWKAKDTQITIAGITISKGLIYVGKSLGKDKNPYETENCLVNPGLKVAQWGDREGRTMGYWPSYSTISPEARRSYLEWLAGDRSDPDAYIGYVFLYFYGLERRLMLERNVPDAAVVADEVRRLLKVYGGNHSFNRYATELLTAVELKSGEPSAQFLAHVEPNGYEVPTVIQIALGVRVRDDRIMEPDLLYRFAMTHPETRARTPAKRAPELMRQLFSEQVSREYPLGFRYKTARAKPLQKHYKACSGSFQVDIDILGGNIPDIAHHAQPIGMARRIFDACSDALDDYSRALGRLPTLMPNLMAVSKLPKALRAQQADLLEGRPLDRIAGATRDGTLTTVAEVARTAGIDVGTPPTKPKLREVSQLLAAFGYGVTFDPAYATKTLSGNDPALIFQITAETAAEPTERFRPIQLAVMLGLVIGHADGHFDDSERDALTKRIEREPSLSADERIRLRAEIRVNEVYPDRLDEWMKRLKDVTPDAKLSVADELISVASADGNLHAAEIRKLELIFKRLGLARQSLYDRLHSGPNSAARTPASSFEDGTVDASAAKPSARIDLSKLHSIRSETSVTATVLADIFADDDADATEPILVQADATAPESETFEGLEQRYGTLLNELRLRASWSAPDFDRLARDTGLMPGAAREAINDWAMDRFDELLIEGEDPVEISLHLLPSSETGTSADTGEGIPA
jgi:tellurite resistance protein